MNKAKSIVTIFIIMMVTLISFTQCKSNCKENEKCEKKEECCKKDSVECKKDTASCEHESKKECCKKDAEKSE